MAKSVPWRNRIVDHGAESPEQLLANPRNFRIHPKNQQDALTGVLNEIGWIQSVIVNQRTGFVIDGHLRVALAISHNEPEIPVAYVDLADEEEALALASIDPIGGLAAVDAEQLESLLRDVSTGEQALQELFAEMAEDYEGATLQAAGESKGRNLGDATKQLKIVIAIEDVGDIEAAIKATGMTNRANAMIAICREYLGSHGSEERQLHDLIEGRDEDQRSETDSESRRHGDARRSR